MPTIISLTYSICCLLFGVTLFKTLLKRSDISHASSPATLCASAFILGQGVLSIIWLVIGMLSIFNTLIIWSILLLMAGSGALLLGNLPARLLIQIKGNWEELKKLPLAWYVILALAGILIFVFGIKSLTNLMLWPDGEAFYFVLPKIMASSEHLVGPRNYDRFTQVGLSGEMHYAALMSISGELAAKFFVWLTALSLTQMLLAICTEVGAKLIGKVTAVAMLFTSTAFTWWLHGGKVEVFSATFGIAAFYWALKTSSKAQPIDLAITGILTGLAIYSKLSYIPTLLPGILIIIYWNSLKFPLFSKNTARENISIAYKSTIVFSFWAGWPLAINAVKNYLLLNEPLAPFLLFHTTASKLFTQSWFSPEATSYILSTYPIALTFGQYPMMGGNTSPLILLAFASIFFIKFKNPAHKHQTLRLAAAATAGVLCWMIVAPSVLCPRYLLPSLLMFIPISSVAYEHLFSSGLANSYNILKGTTYLVIAFMLSITIYVYYNSVRIDYQTISGQTPMQHPRGMKYPAQVYLNEHAKQGDRIWLDGFASYYLRPDLLQCIGGNEGKPEISGIKDRNQLLEHLIVRGFKYILVQKGGGDFITRKFDMNQKNDRVSVEKVYDDDTSIIYELSSSDADIQPLWICEQVNPPAWGIIHK